MFIIIANGKCGSLKTFDTWTNVRWHFLQFVAARVYSFGSNNSRSSTECGTIHQNSPFECTDQALLLLQFGCQMNCQCFIHIKLLNKLTHVSAVNCCNQNIWVHRIISNRWCGKRKSNTNYSGKKSEYPFDEIKIKTLLRRWSVIKRFDSLSNPIKTHTHGICTAAWKQPTHSPVSMMQHRYKKFIATGCSWKITTIHLWTISVALIQYHLDILYFFSIFFCTNISLWTYLSYTLKSIEVQSIQFVVEETFARKRWPRKERVKTAAN